MSGPLSRTAPLSPRPLQCVVRARRKTGTYSRYQRLHGLYTELLQRKRPANLSITHMLRREKEAELDVGEACQAPPDHGVPRRRIRGAPQVAAQSREPDEVHG